MGTHERSFRSAQMARISSRPFRFASVHAGKGTRPGCGAVARKRAHRYLAKHRLPKLLWPIFAAVILIIIVFDRQSVPTLPGVFSQSGVRRKARSPNDGLDEEAGCLTPDTDAALNKGAAPHFRPPTDFQTKHAAQVTAFLIRNRGKVDNDVVREKWKHLDSTSMPLAVYLRDIEANDEWSTLEQEIAACPFMPKSATDRLDAPSSMTHRRVLELMSEWHRRGQDLLISSEPDQPTVPEQSNHDSNDDDTSPKPTRR